MSMFTNETYDMTAIMNSTSLTQFLVETNNLVNGWFGICLIASSFLVFFITVRVSRKEISNGECFADSLYVSMIITLLCWGINIASSKVLVIMMLLTAATIYLQVAHGRNQDLG